MIAVFIGGPKDGTVRQIAQANHVFTFPEVPGFDWDDRSDADASTLLHHYHRQRIQTESNNVVLYTYAGANNAELPNEFSLSHLFPGRTLLYLAGRWEDASQAWEVLGIFLREDLAAARCTKPTDFVSTLVLDDPAPEETIGFPAIRYPKHPDRCRWDHLGTIQHASKLACVKPHLSKEYLDALAKCQCRWGEKSDKDCPLHGSVGVRLDDDGGIVLDDK